MNGGVRTAWVQGFKGKEGKGKERKGRERKGKEGKGRERKGKEGKGREKMGKGGKRKGKEGKGRERKGKEGKGRERKGKEGKGRERKGKEGKGGMTGKRRRWRSASLAARTAARVAGNGWGDEAAGDQRAWLRGRLRTGNGCGELRGRLRTACVQGWLEMGGETKPLEISELGCADGCGREMGPENCVDGCGRRGCKGGWKWVGRRSRWRSASLAARTAAEGKWVGRIARTAADGVGAREWLEMAAGDERAWLRGWLRTGNGCGIARTAADGVGARECLEMGREKKPLVMSELGCADGCGREMGAENCADGCGRRGCNGLAGNGWGEEAAGYEGAWLSRMGNAVGARECLKMGGETKVLLGISELGCADADGVCARGWLEMGGEKKVLWMRLGRRRHWGMSELGCADGCGWRGCKGVAGNGWGEEVAGDERGWLETKSRWE